MVLRVPKLETYLGIEVYASRARGIDGRIRSFPEDFVVEEILADGSKASIYPKEKTVLPSGHGRYFVCLLTKKGWDTLVAVRKVANQIGVSPERINIAGLKDARALTAQHISIGAVPPKRVLKVNLKDVTIDPIRFSSDKISSKLLFGNQFNITVRSIKYCSATIHRRIRQTRDELTDLGGVPNFFGHQRFGTVRPVTHRVGRCLVKEDLKGAISIFLSEPSRHEHPEARKARELLQETQDFKLALKVFPRKLLYERLMLRHLSKFPNDYLGAFRRLPLKIRVFFVQAYQSYIFNRFLSERMRRGIPVGKAEIGDYVIMLNEKGLPTKSFKKADTGDILRINAEIRGAKMAVAIPLIGFNQSTSDGLQGEIEEEILEKEGIDPNDFRIQKIPEASARGVLRTALSPVLSLKIEEKREPTGHDGSIVKFSFTLHKGSYATILLREFMKPRNLTKAGF
jgi:tRNA pseudouridine13 synthase